MNNNYTTDVYNRLMKSMETVEPEPKKTGLLTRNTKSMKKETPSEIDIVRQYVRVIQEQRGNFKDG
tara:strand:- start:669 stop:866 length:198 start_codon:yes stop_codon:yes gene_type:complete